MITCKAKYIKKHDAYIGVQTVKWNDKIIVNKSEILRKTEVEAELDAKNLMVGIEDFYDYDFKPQSVQQTMF